jgi:hypothetical protein
VPCRHPSGALIYDTNDRWIKRERKEGLPSLTLTLVVVVIVL